MSINQPAGAGSLSGARAFFCQRPVAGGDAKCQGAAVVATNQIGWDWPRVRERGKRCLIPALYSLPCRLLELSSAMSRASVANCYIPYHNTLALAPALDENNPQLPRSHGSGSRVQTPPALHLLSLLSKTCPRAQIEPAHDFPSPATRACHQLRTPSPDENTVPSQAPSGIHLCSIVLTHGQL